MKRDDIEALLGEAEKPFVPIKGTKCARCHGDRLAAEEAAFGSLCEFCYCRKLPGSTERQGIRVVETPSWFSS